MLGGMPTIFVLIIRALSPAGAL